MKIFPMAMELGQGLSVSFCLSFVCSLGCVPLSYPSFLVPKCVTSLKLYCIKCLSLSLFVMLVFMGWTLWVQFWTSYGSLDATWSIYHYNE